MRPVPSSTVTLPSAAMLMSLVGRLEHDRAAGAEHGIAAGGDELALIVDLQAAVAGVALAGRRLHHEEAPCRRSRRRAGSWSARYCRRRNRGRCRGPARSETRRSLRRKLSSCAGELRYSSNSDRSALKPLVLTLATLLAMTSICRSSVICRDSPTRSVFSIGGSPLRSIRAAALPSRPADLVEPLRLSQARGLAKSLSESRASLENDDFEVG